MNDKTKVIIQYVFTREEALIAQAKNPSAKLCDKNNYSFFNFEGKDVVAGDKSDHTAYLVAKAKGENPKSIKAK